MSRSNLFFLFAAFLCFASCSKDSFLEVEATPSVQSYAAIQSSEELPSSTNGVADQAARGGETTLQLQVSSATEINGEYIVDFSTTQNLNGSSVKSAQSLDFEDPTGEKASLNFPVNSYVVGTGSLQLTFDLDNNDLTGLDLETIQGIIIIDDVIN